jgi:hypothetical protein
MRKITGSDIVRPIAKTQEWFVETPAVALLKEGQVTSAEDERRCYYETTLVV